MSPRRPWRRSAARPSGPRSTDADLVTVVLVAGPRAEATQRAAASILDQAAGSPSPAFGADGTPTEGSQQPYRTERPNGGRRLQLLVVAESAVEGLPPAAEVVRIGTGGSLALAFNAGLEHARGAVVVFAGRVGTVREDWLRPLIEALDETTAAAQSVVLRSTGAVQCAGVVFSDDGAAHDFLRGFPVEDSSAVAALEFAALGGTALAARTGDVLAVEGFGPSLGAGAAGIDLTRRLRELHGGILRVVPESVAVCTKEPVPEPQTTGSPPPADDAALWGALGLRLRGYDGTRPVVERPRPDVVRDRTPRLRWAIKNPAHAFGAELWGDTHFARRLAEGLRACGQEVVVDQRREWYRGSAVLDDVVVVIRGLVEYQPQPGEMSLLWVISHPDQVTGGEAAAYTRVFAASRTWSAERTAGWRLQVTPLLQATDPALFHPDLAQPDTGEPLLFVGTSHGKGRPMVDAALAAGLPLAVYGPRWEGLIPAANLRAEYAANERLGAVYRAAGVVLNDHHEDMRREGFVSNRLFDAAASGARVVSDEVAGADGLFGRSVRFAADASKLARLVKGDLDAEFGDDSERRVVAARVRAEHSFEARARTLLDAALAALR